MPEGKYLKLQKFNHWQRIACKAIDLLLD